MSNNKETKKDTSMFLYTALIFIAAILVIILAFFSQTHLKNAQPVSEIVSVSPDANLQGIQKSVSELSDKNMELLEENRNLNKRLDKTEAENEIFTKLLEANRFFRTGDSAEAKKLIADITYEALSSDAKTLYDEIKNAE